MGFSEEQLNMGEIRKFVSTSCFNENECNALYRRFCFLDKKNLGYLCFTDFEAIPEFIANPFRHLILQNAENQLDESEKMNFGYFLDFLSIFHRKTSKSKRINFLFSIFDLNKSHRLSKSTFNELFKILGITATEENLEEVLKYDNDQKGYLDIADFTKFYNDDGSLEKVMVFDFNSLIDKPQISSKMGFFDQLWRS